MADVKYNRGKIAVLNLRHMVSKIKMGSSRKKRILKVGGGQNVVEKLWCTVYPVYAIRRVGIIVHVEAQRLRVFRVTEMQFFRRDDHTLVREQRMCDVFEKFAVIVFGFWSFEQRGSETRKRVHRRYRRGCTRKRVDVHVNRMLKHTVGV